MREHHLRPAGMPPVNGYSHLVAFTGQMIVVSGQLPLDDRGQLVGAEDPEAQVRQVFENISAALAAVGAHLTDVVRLGVYLTDLTDLGAFRAARDSYLRDPLPASSLVQVSGLVVPGAKVEIDAMAVR